jgi:cytochrome c553
MMRPARDILIAGMLVLSLGLPARAQIAAAHNFAGGVGSCEGCHGAGGNSEMTSVPRLNGQQADYIISRVEQILDLPAQPPGSQIAQLAAGLDQAALASIARHFSSQPPSPRKPDSLAMVGKHIYENGDPARFVMACKGCHGASGEGHSLGGARIVSVGRNILHSALKVRDRDRWILCRNFLKRLVIDAVACKLLPITHPVNADSTIAVIDQQWPRTGGWRSINVGWVTSGYFLHDPDPRH